MSNNKKITKSILMFFVLVLIVGNSTTFAATIGTELLQPEEGWSRYDDTDDRFLKLGDWNYLVDSHDYGGGVSHTSDSEGKIKFKFKGTKVRFIITPWHNKPSNVPVYIDGNLIGTYNCYTPSAEYTILGLEKLDLAYGVHEVIIETPVDMPSTQNWTLDAVDIDASGELLDPNASSNILDIEFEKKTIKIGEEVSADLIIENIENIAAEDMIIKYDSNKLEYLGYEEVDGIILAYNNQAIGELRLILASEGANNIVNNKRTLLKLRFKGICIGDALTDIIEGKVTDGIESEVDLQDKDCGDDLITVEGILDVNNTGEFTLLDLGIDARHLNEDPNAIELSAYNTDIVINNAIDKADLLEIGKFILLNSNYSLYD